MINSTFLELAPSAYRQLPGNHSGGDRSISSTMSPPIDQLIAPTWADIEEVQTRYNRDAKRLRYWGSWFVGMFTLYTTLVGILLLEVIVGP